MKPAISVILPVYNAAAYLRAAVESLLGQTFRDFELIAVDDGSTDGSGALLAELARGDERVRVISRPNTGIVGALNDGVAAARADLVARMDADDVAEPGRLAVQHAYMEATPGCVVLGTGAWLIDSRGEVVGLHEPAQKPELILRHLLAGDGGVLLHPTIMMRRAAFDAAGGYARECELAEDLDLYFRLLKQGAGANLPAPWLRYRQHKASANFRRREAQRQIVETILEREFAERGLARPEQSRMRGPADLSAGERHAAWALGALQHGAKRTALRHAARAVLHAPATRDSWRVLKYVLAGRCAEGARREGKA
jgi:GT2 family glycosyltransferase